VREKNTLTPEERQAVLDDEHLRLLALFHYISGGVTVVFSLLFALWTVFASTMVASFPPRSQGDAVNQPLQFMPQMMFVVFGVFCAIGVIYGIAEIVSGRLISQRRGRIFTLIASLPRLLFMSYGVILTIFTLMVLDRPSVQQLYRQRDGL
jgi:hypothetical protein